MAHPATGTGSTYIYHVPLRRFKEHRLMGVPYRQKQAAMIDETR